jgi:predicted nucleic acid-binding protein
MTRVFLDANVLFSAAYSERNSIQRLWKLDDVQLVTSAYALAEAERNISSKSPEALARLATLVTQIDVTLASARSTKDHGLPEKDVPILQAAVGSRCSYLLTGDDRHFGHLFDKSPEGVRVLTIRSFLITQSGR